MTSPTWGSMVSAVCFSTSLDNILMAAWLTGKSPVLMIGLRTLTTISGGSRPDMVAAQASAALTTWNKTVTGFGQEGRDTHVLLGVLVSLQHLQDYQLSEGVEASDKRVLF